MFVVHAQHNCQHQCACRYTRVVYFCCNWTYHHVVSPWVLLYLRTITTYPYRHLPNVFHVAHCCSFYPHMLVALVGALSHAKMFRPRCVLLHHVTHINHPRKWAGQSPPLPLFGLGSDFERGFATVEPLITWIETLGTQSGAHHEPQSRARWPLESRESLEKSKGKNPNLRNTKRDSPWAPKSCKVTLRESRESLEKSKGENPNLRNTKRDSPWAPKSCKVTLRESRESFNKQREIIQTLGTQNGTPHEPQSRARWRGNVKISEWSKAMPCDDGHRIHKGQPIIEALNNAYLCECCILTFGNGSHTLSDVREVRGGIHKTLTCVDCFNKG